MHHQPDGAAFDIVLLLHVASVVVGIVTTATAAATARRLRRQAGSAAGSAAPLSEALRRYYRPGVNWAGRSVYGIPVFGFALLAMSQGAYALGDGWVLIGLALFVLLAVVAEVVMWPAERRLQHTVTAVGPGLDRAQGAVPLQADAATLERSATIVLLLLVAGIIVMIAQP
ncbi:MAG TPA: hypothetical protein VHS57_02475 [Acidimicrobiales bacterium]|nr:hypothetical protein [Acidimicrobiales bacterium]